jgi:divalent metal cation (Fe/Co/Zn/Cd) transporter
MTFFEYLRESKDPTAKTVIFEDSAALLGIAIAAAGIYLTDHHTGPKGGAYWDGLSSIVIGIVLAIVAFVLARTSRGLLLGEAASPKSVTAIMNAIKRHPNVVDVVELLTMHLAPKQILINAHVKLRENLATDEIERTILEIEEEIKKAEPKVDMIFLEAAQQRDSERPEPVLEKRA